MHYTAEQINKAFDKLPTIISKAIYRVKIDEKIIEISNKYQLNKDISSTLSMYIHFVLIGLMSMKDFEMNIIKDLGLPKESSDKIINDVNELIFKVFEEKIKELKEVEELLYEIDENKRKNPMSLKTEDEIPLPPTFKINPRFNILPKNLQNAIMESDYEKKIEEISKRYELPENQIRMLEEAIIKTILGDINLNGLGLELQSKITLPDEDIVKMIEDVNTEIFKKIRMLVKYENSDVPLPSYPKEIIPEKKEEVEIIKEEQTPLPNITQGPMEEDIPLPNYETPEAKAIEKDNKDIYKEHGVEVIEGESYKDDDLIKKEKNLMEEINKEAKDKIDYDHYRDSGIDIIGHKLVSPTINTETISDYTLPKISQNKDPYKEQI